MKDVGQQALLDAVGRFRRKKILVVGDIMLDLYIEGPPRFVSQEAPVVVLRVENKYYKLGGAANSAENIKALGGKVWVAGVVGNHVRHDDVGRSLFETIRRSKLPLDGIVVDRNRPTTLKMRILSQQQQIVRVDEEDAQPLARESERRLIRFVTKMVPIVDTVLVSDYYKGVVTPRVMAALKKLARRHDRQIVVDPRPQNRELYRGANFITPNDVELSRMFGQYEVDEHQLIHLAKRLQTEYQIEHVLLTRGGRGMELISGAAKVQHFPALSKKVVDISGAGDTVAAVVALGVQGLDPRHLAFLASVAAKVSIEKQGTATVSNAELVAALRQHFR